MVPSYSESPPAGFWVALGFPVALRDSQAVSSYSQLHPEALESFPVARKGSGLPSGLPSWPQWLPSCLHKALGCSTFPFRGSQGDGVPCPCVPAHAARLPAAVSPAGTRGNASQVYHLFNMYLLGRREIVFRKCQD